MESKIYLGRQVNIWEGVQDLSWTSKIHLGLLFF